MKTELLGLCDQVIAAALNGVYQGLVLVFFVGLSLRVLIRTNAATRHAAWMTALILVALLLPVHFCWPRWARDSSERKESHPKGTVRPGAAGSGVTEHNSQLSATGAQTPPRCLEPAPASGLERSAHPLASSLGFQHKLETGSPWQPARFFSAAAWNIELLSKAPRLTSAVFVAVGIIIASIRLAIFLGRLWQLRQLKACSRAASDDLKRLLDRLCAQGRVRRKVELRVSSLPRSPVVLGFLHPMILLPANPTVEFGAEAVERILRHELAHVRRYDDWANLLQHFLQAVLFFHPAVWWIGQRLSLEREIACDDQVLAQCGRSKAYALLLVDVAHRLNGPHPTLAPGVSTNNTQLQQRISMILSPHRNTSPRLAKAKLGFVTSAAALVALLALYLGPRLVLAQNATILAPATPADTAEAGVAAASTSTAQADAASTATPADLDKGPKVKSPDNSTDDSPSTSPPEPRGPRARALPRPPRAPEAAARGSSVEERLDRLERMVKSLMAQQNVKTPRPEHHIVGPDGQEKMFGLNDLNELKENIKRDVARAAEDAKRAAKEARNAFKAEAEHRDNGLRQEFDRQLRALQKQRDSLQREMEKLQRQIERMKEEHERMSERQERQGRLESKPSEAEDSEKPETAERKL